MGYSHRSANVIVVLVRARCRREWALADRGFWPVRAMFLSACGTGGITPIFFFFGGEREMLL